jgi:hypothetical protein
VRTPAAKIRFSAAVAAESNHCSTAENLAEKQRTRERERERGERERKKERDRERERESTFENGLIVAGAQIARDFSSHAACIRSHHDACLRGATLLLILLRDLPSSRSHC